MKMLLFYLKKNFRDSIQEKKTMYEKNGQGIIILISNIFFSFFFKYTLFLFL